jgi:hypothetical protein
MIFDTSDRFALSKVSAKANLIDPYIRQDESAIATFAFDLALFQVGRLNDTLKQELDRPFGKRIGHISKCDVPQAVALRLRPIAGFLIKIGE